MSSGKVSKGWWSYSRHDMSLQQSTQVSIATLGVAKTRHNDTDRVSRDTYHTSKREGDEEAKASYKHEWHSKQMHVLHTQQAKHVSPAISPYEPT